jgi:hypothetical protein
MPATWQAGDTAPPIRFTITEDGVAVDLTELDAVKFRFSPKGQTALFERECVIDEEIAEKNECYCNWQEGDLDESGEYEGQLLLLYPAGEGEEEGTQRLSAPFEIVVARSIPAPEEEPET